MEMLRFYHHPLVVGRVQLSLSEAHHFVGVMRGKVGDSIELFDGQGVSALGVVAHIRKNDVFVEIANVVTQPPRLHRRIILATAIAKGQRFDWMLAKCTELGVDHIALVQFERSVRLGRDSAVERYQSLTVAACKQCGRSFLPELTAPKRLIEVIADLKAHYPQSRLYYGSPLSNAKTLRQLDDKSESDAVIFVGPEGGLTEMEDRLLLHHGAIPVQIAAQILRTETAAMAFVAVFEALRTGCQ
jgi:16S rRNA (uracil1498-N3)-methyltransferase